jgi:hypothetical protein
MTALLSALAAASQNTAALAAPPLLTAALCITVQCFWRSAATLQTVAQPLTQPLAQPLYSRLDYRVIVIGLITAAGVPCAAAKQVLPAAFSLRNSSSCSSSRPCRQRPLLHCITATTTAAAAVTDSIDSVCAAVAAAPGHARRAWSRLRRLASRWHNR